MDRPAVVLTVLVASTLFVGTVAGAAPFALGAAQEFDRVQFTVTVTPSGTAEWTFQYERRLANASERRQFESYADRFTSEETPLFRDFRNQTIALTRLGREATGRPMNATDVSRDAFVREGLNTVGVVQLSFTWTAFAATEGSKVIVGDVFEGGFYLGPEQSFVIAAGEGLQFATVEPEGTFSGATAATSDTVTWQGERTFSDNHPRVVLEPNEASGTTTTSGTTSQVNGDGSPRSPTRSPGTTTAVTGSGSPWTLIGIGVVVAIGVLAAFGWFRRDSVGESGEEPSQAAETSLSEAELMEDEERVVSLIEAQGGRMRQSAIVEETGWSKSKVSMVLSEMTDDGLVTKLQLGRENLISLPGREPEAAGSPLDELEDETDEE